MKFGLTKCANNLIGVISGGEKRRLSCASEVTKNKKFLKKN